MQRTRALRDLNKLNAFVRVAERLSFTKAAHELHTAPSVVSKHMTELEDDLGFSLLNRSTRGVALTQAGEGLFKCCLEMLDKIDKYVVKARNQQTGPYGTLRILSVGGYAARVLNPLLSQFAHRYPTLRIRLFAEAESRTAMEEGCDVILACQPPSIPGLIDSEIGVIDHVICASPEYFRLRGVPATPQALREHNCLVNSATAPREWWFRAGTKDLAVEVKGTVFSDSSAALVQLALDGIGIVRVPRVAAAKPLARGKLQAIFEDSALSPERLSVYFSKTKHLPAKVTEFIDFLRASADETGLVPSALFLGDGQAVGLAQGGEEPAP